MCQPIWFIGYVFPEKKERVPMRQLKSSLFTKSFIETFCADMMNDAQGLIETFPAHSPGSESNIGIF